MSMATAKLAVAVARNRALKQDPTVAEKQAASAFTRQASSSSDLMRAAIGLIDPDDGHAETTILIRHSDPFDADDHRHYWGPTIATRWRWNGQGLDLDGVAKPGHDVYDVISEAIVEAVERLRK